jgi:hypothetical protein
MIANSGFISLQEGEWWVFVDTVIIQMLDRQILTKVPLCTYLIKQCYSVLLAQSCIDLSHNGNPKITIFKLETLQCFKLYIFR